MTAVFNIADGSNSPIIEPGWTAQHPAREVAKEKAAADKAAADKAAADKAAAEAAEAGEDD